MIKQSSVALEVLLSVYGKNTLKIFFPGTTGQILMNLCWKHKRPKPFIICIKETFYGHISLKQYATGILFAIKNPGRIILVLILFILFSLFVVILELLHDVEAIPILCKLLTAFDLFFSEI